MTWFNKKTAVPHTKMKLKPEESDEIHALRLVLVSAESKARELAIIKRSLRKDVSETIMKFVQNHKMNLNKSYNLVGEYPDYYIERGKPKTVDEKESNNEHEQT